MSIPDVLGMDLERAKALLVAEGLDFNVIETKPTKGEPVDGILRVIRVQPEDPGMIGWVLTVCRI